jgi:hypothetical protein
VEGFTRKKTARNNEKLETETKIRNEYECETEVVLIPHNTYTHVYVHTHTDKYARVHKYRATGSRGDCFVPWRLMFVIYRYESRFALLASRIKRWLLDFWHICRSLLIHTYGE